MSTSPDLTETPDGAPVGAWRWRLETGDGHVTGHTEGFESQSDAETWLGAEFDDLLGHGVDQVTLLEGDREAYGPMSLHQA